MNKVQGVPKNFLLASSTCNLPTGMRATVSSRETTPTLRAFDPAPPSMAGEHHAECASRPVVLEATSSSTVELAQESIPSSTDAINRSTFFTTMAARIRESRNALKQANNLTCSQGLAFGCTISEDEGHVSTLQVGIQPRVPNVKTTRAPREKNESKHDAAGADAAADVSTSCRAHDDPDTYYLIGLVGDNMRERIAWKWSEIERLQRRHGQFGVSAPSPDASHDTKIGLTNRRLPLAGVPRNFLLKRGNRSGRSPSPPCQRSILRNGALSVNCSF